MKTDTSTHHTHTCPSHNIIIDDSSDSFTMKSTIEILFGSKNTSHCWCGRSHAMHAIVPYSRHAHHVHAWRISLQFTLLRTIVHPPIPPLCISFPSSSFEYDTEMADGIFLMGAGRLRELRSLTYVSTYVQMSRPAGSRNVLPAGANTLGGPWAFRSEPSQPKHKEPSRREP